MTSPPLLTGVRVVDLSQYIPGPFATRQLADLGADVIKIEPPGGDPMRRFMAAGKADSAVYRHLNRGKRVCRLDLKHETDAERLRGLISAADILLESYRPGVLGRLGFGREVLDKLNPRLIHCALSGYGQEGPYAQRAGHDINYCALSSQALHSGTADAPVIAYPPISDHAAGLQAAVAMLAALHARGKNGSGAFLDISISESILSWQHLSLLGGGERAATLLNGGAACYNIYRCGDGRFVSIGAVEPAFWENFCRALQRREWIPRQFESMPQRELIAEVAALVASQAREHWRALLDGVDCCFEVLFGPNEVARHPQFAHRQALNANGPAYPAWIDDRPVEPAAAPEAIESVADLGWRPSRRD